MWQIKKPGPLQDLVTDPDRKSRIDGDASPSTGALDTERHIDLKVELHKRLLDLINLSALDGMSREQGEAEVGEIVHEQLALQKHALNHKARKHLVADVLDVVADLSRGRDGLWKPITVELATLAREGRGRPRLGGPRTEGCLVLGAQHGHFVRQARDSARKRIFVSSHRLGLAAKQAIIIPAMAAARDHRSVETQVFFGRPTGNMTGEMTAGMTLDVGKEGVQIRSVHEPRLHAKMLAWDDDCVVITSQNWLSSDPGESSPLQEIGVYLKGSRIADNVITTFLNARQY